VRFWVPCQFATQEVVVDIDSDARCAREVGRKVWRDNDFLLPGKASPNAAARCRQSAGSIQRNARGSAAVALRALEQLGSEVAPKTLTSLRIVALRARLVGVVSPQTQGSGFRAADA
jgi:hypothetical protein